MLQKSKSSKFLKLKYLLLVPIVCSMLVYSSCTQETKAQNQTAEIAETKTDSKSKIIANIEALIESIAEKGNITEEEEMALKELIVLTDGNKLENPYFEDVKDNISLHFGIIQKVPTYPGCAGDNEELKKCFSKTNCDSPAFWQTYLHDPASITMEGILLFNKHLLFLLTVIILFVGWLLFSTIYYYVEFNNAHSSKFIHSKELEIVWTSVPALILLILSTPSFTLLYAMDEIAEPELSLKILGHQWFWSYEISDFNSCQKQEQSLKYVCYMMVLDGLPKTKQGYFRLLETNKRVILPTNTHLRLLVTAADVLHSWTVPSFGLKVDACPGRLNQLNLFIKRVGVFFGQCSEICGVNHGFMPIVVVSLPTLQFHHYIMTKLELG